MLGQSTGVPAKALLGAALRAEQYLRWLAAPALLLALVAGSVAWAVNDPGIYRNGFARYDVAARSGIAEDDLLTIGRELRRYFNTGQEPLSVQAPIYGAPQAVFSPREIAHMYDVKRLVRGVYWVAAGASLYLLALLAAGFAAHRRAYRDTAARLAIAGGGLTLAAVFAVGLAAVVNFDGLFLLFHQISFANDLWMLDPRRDYLLVLFPAGFWFDATLRVALTSILGALLLLSTGGATLAYARWRRRHPGLNEAR